MVPIKVLHLIDSGGLYGAEMMLLNLVEEQLKSGLDPLILSAGALGTQDKAIELEAKKRGLPVRQVRLGAGINFVKVFQIIFFAKREGFDVMHSHGYKFNILIGIVPKFIRKVPFLTTLHGYTTAKGFSKIKIYQMLERIILKRLDGIVYVSNELKKNPILKGFKAKHEVTIFNGIDASKVIAGVSDSDSITIKEFFPKEKGDHIYIGAIGRLSQEKGFDLLIDAFSELAVNNPNIRLIIIGEGVLRPQLEHKISTHNLQDKIKLPGYINPVYRLMKDLDGLVMPSHTEGLPITLLEACILNLSIVASRVGSIEEVLSDYESSVVVEPGNIAELKEAIKKLIIKKSEKESPAREWRPTAFDPKTMTNKYTEFYSQLIGLDCNV
jgi:glycosyltransferase involved in cell wall biosynthesis